ncbi:MAG: hypothetical protein JO073_07000 [Actinobacteria bacterium]|nr:hypothetical protein [Actinomycetota bacterium]
MRIRPLLALAAAAASMTVLVAAPPAGAKMLPGSPPFRVLVMDEIPSGMFARFAKAGAVGLLVPEIGPTTNRRQSLAELERGAQVNARLGGVPAGPRLLATSHATGFPTARDVVIVELPPPGAPIRNDRRYRIAVIGRGFHGLLTSKTTRIPGLVSIVDIAPTVLGRVTTSLGSEPFERPLAYLARMDEQIHAENRLKFAALFIVAGALALLGLLGLRAALTAIPAALLTSLGLGVAHTTNEVAIVAVLTAGTIGGALWLARACRGDSGLLALVLGTVGAYMVAFATHPDWAAITPLGPTQNQRFWGIGNQMETLLLAPMLVAAVLARRLFGVAGFAGVALLGLFVMGDNRLGADGGGVIALGVALAFLGARLLRRGLVGLLISLGVAAVTALAIVLHGLNSPGPNHLRSAFSHGVRGLADVFVNRVPLAYAPAVHQWPLTLPLALAFLVSVALALRSANRRIVRDVLFALGAAMVASLVVNDSTAYILAGGVACVGALVRFQPEAGMVRVPLPALLRRQPAPAAEPVGRD